MIRISVSCLQHSIALLAFFLFISVNSFSQLAIPEHGGRWVHDDAGILSAQTVQYLEQYLKQDRDSTSNQIAVYIIKSLEGEDIDDYTFRVFQKWQLGQKDKVNGILYLIAIEDRKFRIEVGDGLEGVLTDLQASRINRDRVAPYFRLGDFDNGVVAGVTAIRETIKGEYINDNPQPVKRKRRGSSLYTILIIIAVIAFLSRRRGGGGGGGYWSSGGGWILPGGGFGSSSGSWGGGSGSDFGGGGFSSGGGSSDSW